MKNATFDKSEMMTSINSALKSAKTPEDAYRIFMNSAGEGMLQVIADALQDVVDATEDLQSNNPNIEGWEKFIVGPMVEMNFGSINDRTAFIDGNVPKPAVQETRVAVVPARLYLNPDLQGGSITVSGTWSF